MYLSSKIVKYVSLVALMAIGTTANAASTNPWAMPQQQGQAQGNGQGGFNMGGGFTLGGGAQPQANLRAPQFVAPQPVVPAQPPAQRVQPQIKAPAPTQQQFGIYAPLIDGNTQTSIAPARPQVQVAPRPVQPYASSQGYNYGQVPYGYNGGNNGFGFPGFGGFPGFNGFNNFGFGFGFGGNLVAPGPMMPGYGNPYYQNYQQPRYQQPRYQQPRYRQPRYRVQPGRTTN